MEQIILLLIALASVQLTLVPDLKNQAEAGAKAVVEGQVLLSRPGIRDGSEAPGAGLNETGRSPNAPAVAAETEAALDNVAAEVLQMPDLTPTDVKEIREALNDIRYEIKGRSAK